MPSVFLPPMGWMDGWMDGRMDGWTDGRFDASPAPEDLGRFDSCPIFKSSDLMKIALCCLYVSTIQHNFQQVDFLFRTSFGTHVQYSRPVFSYNYFIMHLA
jgi:hypothetical protein